jgi:pimeloyl-ACP methyl ester carboxylesterase
VEAAAEAAVTTWTRPDAPRERVAAMQRRAFALQADIDWPPTGFDPLERDLDALRAFEAPTLIMVGEQDMHDFHLAADALVGALPDARKVVLADAGHLAPLEQPHAFRELLPAFIANRA